MVAVDGVVAQIDGNVMGCYPIIPQPLLKLSHRFFQLREIQRSGPSLLILVRVGALGRGLGAAVALCLTVAFDLVSSTPGKQKGPMISAVQSDIMPFKRQGLPVACLGNTLPIRTGASVAVVGFAWRSIGG
jgi:hypothetical protein